jgi:hypothetical protein
MLPGLRSRCAADLDEQAQPIVDRHAPLGAVHVDRRAFDVLHHEVRRAVLARAAVEHTRDVRVLELREQAALAAETLQHLRAVEPGAQQLERRALFEVAALAPREVHRAHAAAAQPAFDAPRADARADTLFVEWPQFARGLDERLRRLEVFAQRLVARDQPQDFGLEFRVADRTRANERGALLARLEKRRFEQLSHLSPAFARRAHRMLCAESQPRRCRVVWPAAARSCSAAFSAPAPVRPAAERGWRQRGCFEGTRTRCAGPRR